MLIFDLDGTLWNNTNSAFISANEIAKEFEDVKEFDIDTIKRGMGLSAKENAQNYMPYLDEEKALYYLKKIDERNIEIIGKNGTEIYEGVYETIINLSKKYKLGIVTNSTYKYAELFMNIANLRDFFIDYIGATTYTLTKAQAIRQLMDRNNEPNSFYIGDIRKDMEASEEAGAKFIQARYGFDKTLKAQYFIDDIKELEKLLETITKGSANN